MIKNLYLNDTIVGYNNPAGVTRMVVDTSTGKTSVIVRGRQIQLSNETLSADLTEILRQHREDIDSISGQIASTVSGLPIIRDAVITLSGQVNSTVSGLQVVNQHIDILDKQLNDVSSGLTIKVDQLSSQVFGQVSGLQTYVKQKFVDVIRYKGSVDVLPAVTIQEFCIKKGILPSLWPTVSSIFYNEYLSSLPQKNDVYLYNNTYTMFRDNQWQNITYDTVYIDNIKSTVRKAFTFKGQVPDVETLLALTSVVQCNTGDVYQVISGQWEGQKISYAQFAYTDSKLWVKLGSSTDQIQANIRTISGDVKNLKQQLVITSGKIQDETNRAISAEQLLSTAIVQNVTLKGELSSVSELIDIEAKSDDPESIYYNTFTPLRGDYYVLNDSTNRSIIYTADGRHNWKILGIDGYTKQQIDLQNYVLSTNITNQYITYITEVSGNIDKKISAAIIQLSGLDQKISAQITQEFQKNAKQLSSNLQDFTIDKVNQLSTVLDDKDIHFKGLVDSLSTINQWEYEHEVYQQPFIAHKGDLYILSGATESRRAVIKTATTEKRGNWQYIGIDGYTKQQIDQKLIEVINLAQAANDQLSSDLRNDIRNEYISHVAEISSLIHQYIDYTVSGSIQNLSGILDEKIKTKADKTYVDQLSTVVSGSIEKISGIIDKLDFQDVNYKGVLTEKQFTEMVSDYHGQTPTIKITSGDLYLISDIGGVKNTYVPRIFGTEKDLQDKYIWHEFGVSGYYNINDIDQKLSSIITGYNNKAQQQGQKALISATTYTDQLIGYVNGNISFISGKVDSNTQLINTVNDNLVSSNIANKQYTDQLIGYVSGKIDSNTQLINTVNDNLVSSNIANKQYTDLQINNLSATVDGKIAGVFHYKGSVKNMWELEDLSATVVLSDGDVYTVLTADYSVDPQFAKYIEHGVTVEYGVEFVRGNNDWIKLGYQVDLSKLENTCRTLSSNIIDQTNRALSAQNNLSEQIITVDTNRKKYIDDNFCPISTYNVLLNKFNEQQVIIADLSGQLDDVRIILEQVSGIIG